MHFLPPLAKLIEILLFVPGNRFLKKLRLNLTLFLSFNLTVTQTQSFNPKIHLNRLCHIVVHFELTQPEIKACENNLKTRIPERI